MTKLFLFFPPTTDVRCSLPFFRFALAWDLFITKKGVCTKGAAYCAMKHFHWSVADIASAHRALADTFCPTARGGKNAVNIRPTAQSVGRKDLHLKDVLVDWGEGWLALPVGKVHKPAALGQPKNLCGGEKKKKTERKTRKQKQKQKTVKEKPEPEVSRDRGFSCLTFLSRTLTQGGICDRK